MFPASVRVRTRVGLPSTAPAIVSLAEGPQKLSVAYLAVTLLKPADRSTRSHSPKHIQQIAASITKFGFVNPVLVDSGGKVVAGHGRLAAAKHLNMTEVPTLCLAHMSETDLRAYRLADNRLAELSGWDNELLALELGELAELDLNFQIETLGWNTAELDQLISLADPSGDDAEEVAPVPEDQAVSRLGDLWILGQHRLLCGDALDPCSFTTLLDGEQAQMVFTDPPYNVPICGHVSGLGRQTHREFAMASGEMSPSEFTAFLSTLFANLVGASCNGSIHFICMDWRHMHEVLTAGQAAYTELKNLCVWNKDNGGMGTFYRSKHELVFAYKNGAARHINNFGLGEDGRYRTNVWDYAGVNTFRRGRNEDLASHPTVKPTPLVMDAIKDCSQRLGVVLDAFGGSGTTLIAAERTGRRAYLLEIDPLYVDVIIRRWQTLTGETARLSRSDISFAEAAEQRLVDIDVQALGACHV